jgi:integrase
MHKLNAAKIRPLTKPGTYGDGGGLYLKVRSPEHRSWLFRFKLAGKPHLMGLGRLSDVGLGEARDAAVAARKLVRAGVNPIQQRKQERAPDRDGLSFGEVASAYLESHEVSWRNARHRQQWRNTLATYVEPLMGRMPVAAIDVGMVMRVLQPMWLATPETASRVRGRIESILDYAKARGWRTGENPARWRGHLDHLLPARAKIRTVRHHAALPWPDAGSFMHALASQEGVAALALRFLVLTAARTGEVLGARWDEIDLANALWTVPGGRMKAGREHRVPLSGAALDILRMVAPWSAAGDLVFPGRTTGRPLSANAMGMVLCRMGRGDLTVHGLRSTFRDWAAEATGYPNHVVEQALAHTLRSEVEAAYRRGDLIDKRRRLMGDWALFSSRPQAVADVLPLWRVVE